MGEIRADEDRADDPEFSPPQPLPAERAEEPLVVELRRRRSFLGHLLRICLFLVFVCALSIGGLIAAIEGGGLDPVLSGRAEQALNAALAPQYRAEIGSSAIRFNNSGALGMMLAIEARDVTMKSQENGDTVARTQSVRLALDPWALVGGRISIDRIAAEGMEIDTAAFSQGGPGMSLADLRVDSIPAGLQTGFSWLDQALGFMIRSGTTQLALDDIALAVAGRDGRPVPLRIGNLTLSRSGTEMLSLQGSLAFEQTNAAFRIQAQGSAARMDSLVGSVEAVDLTPFMLQRDKTGAIREGFTGTAQLNLLAGRGDAANKPALTIKLASPGGTIYFDGKPQSVERVDLAIGYDFMKNTIELLPSEAQFGPMKLPFTGGIIDLDRLDGGGQQGFGIDFLANDAWASVPSSGEQGFPFSLKAFGRYFKQERSLKLENLTAQTPAGTLNGGLSVQFGEGSPEIRFDAKIDAMQIGIVKQLWPYWMASKPREWVFDNVYGGTVRNASIMVHVPAGRMSVEPVPLELGAGELELVLDLDTARVNVTGEIPPIRDTMAHIELHGEKLSVNVTGGTSYFGSDRSVAVTNAQIDIASTYRKPLMADVKVALSGAADAVAELASFKPINGLQRTGFEAGDFSGNVTGTVDLTLGLIMTQKPPPPVWHANLVLDGVSVAKPIDGRHVTDFKGALDLDEAAARLNGAGKIDGASMEVELVEPVGSTSTVARERVVRLKLSDKELDILAPQLDGIVDGNAQIELTRVNERQQAVVADLGQSTLTVPFVGWTKGKGVAAKARFTVSEDGDLTRIDDFSLDGDGFGGTGKMVVSKDGLVSAAFSQLKLAPSDDFSLNLKQDKGVYRIDVSGKSADLRSILGRLKGSDGAGGGSGKSDSGGKGFSGSIEAKLDRATGFNDEALKNLSFVYIARGGRTSKMDVAAVSAAGQAVVGQLAQKDKEAIVTFTSGDAGAVLRFVGLYEHMRGGLLNFRLQGGDGQPWTGFADVRNFKLENEPRLASIVSTPAGDGGESLNAAVKRKIDVTSARFQRAYAQVVYLDGALRIDNGILRGEQVGATFQGTVKDAAGNMDMTGTFMPAYGLNRLFAELPIIGIILGNGRDRGLIGITFKLTGPTETPKLVVNPLSVIAPGVFRQIFEFQ